MTTSTTISPPISGSGVATIQAALNSYDHVTLEAGSEWEIDSPVYLKRNNVLYTNSQNPAILSRNSTTTVMVVLNGTRASVYNIWFDFNPGGTWDQYVEPIAFRVPDGSTVKPRQKGYNRLENLRFFSSTDVGEHGDQGSNTGDSFCINLTNDSPKITKNARIRNCKCLVPGFQLTGNGSGKGYENLLIENNEIFGGRANSIAISSLNTAEPTVLRNVKIRNNRIHSTRSIGIFVGQDGEGTARYLQIENLEIKNNYIQTADNEVSFQMGYLLRGGQIPGSTLSVSILGNTLDLRSSDGRDPRTIVMYPCPTVGATLDFQDNIHLGEEAESLYTGVTVTESGNFRASSDGSVDSWGFTP